MPVTKPTKGDDPIVDWLIENGIDVTRQNYIDYGYDDVIIDNWGIEMEEQLPEYLQDWSLFEEVDGDVIYRAPEKTTG